MKKLMVILAAGIAALMVDAAPTRQGPQLRPQARRAVEGKRSPGRGERSHRGHDRHDRLGKQDQRLIDAIEDADSLHELRRYLQAAAMSRAEDVRMAMVDALEDEDMHGRSAADLAYFIADPNERVSAAAFSAWSSVLEDTHGERRVRAILETADILRGFSGGLWQRPGGYPSSAVVPVTQPGVVPVTQPVTVPAAQPVVVPAVR